MRNREREREREIERERNKDIEEERGKNKKDEKIKQRQETNKVICSLHRVEGTMREVEEEVEVGASKDTKRNSSKAYLKQKET